MCRKDGLAIIMNAFTVTTIIPTRNGANELRELLALLNQQTFPLTDIHVVDSSSEDNSVQIAEDAGAQVEVIPQSAFDHGGTRTATAKRTSGDIVLFFTQDALPATRDAVERLLAPFYEDPDLAVCYGRQLPSFDAEFSAKQLREFNYPPTSSVRDFEDRAKYGLKTIFTSNTFAAYRRSMLAEIDYFENNLIFGEDTQAVGKLLKSGYKVAYVADAKVYHSHNYTFEEEFKRSFDIGVLHTSEAWLLETYGRAEGIGKKFVLDQLTALFKERKFGLLLDCFFRSCCKYLGYAFGRRYTKLPKKFVTRCSMHKTWWK